MLNQWFLSAAVSDSQGVWHWPVNVLVYVMYNFKWGSEVSFVEYF